MIGSLFTPNARRMRPESTVADAACMMAALHSSDAYQGAISVHGQSEQITSPGNKCVVSWRDSSNPEPYWYLPEGKKVS